MEEMNVKGGVPLSDDEISEVSSGTFGEINQIAKVMGLETRTQFNDWDEVADYVGNIAEEMKKYNIVGKAWLDTSDSNEYTDKQGNAMTHKEVMEGIAKARGIKLVWK